MGDKIILVLIYVLIVSCTIRHVARTIGFIIDLRRSLTPSRPFR